MMPRSRALGCGFAALVTTSLFADVSPDAAMLRYPDVGRDRIVFVYANDLWTAPLAGGAATLLANPEGQELFPRFSPDGSTVAFVGNYEGNRDLYTVPVAGGPALRVTHHPAGETLCDWTADSRLLFFTNGLAGLQRQSQLFTTAATGGMPERLPVPYGTMASISPDGRFLAYTPHTTDFRTWKRYRGGMATDIWIFDLQAKSSRRVTTWEGTDTAPMWHGSMLYYLTDEGSTEANVLNLWRFDPSTGERTQVTRLTEFDVKWPSIGPGPRGTGTIVFQHGAELKSLDLADGTVAGIKVTIPGDRPRLRPQWINAAEHLGDWTISPSGKRVAVEARGDLWSVPAEHGSPRNLTRTAGVFERYPQWSPDGRWIAYFSDESGEYELYVTQSDGKEEAKRLTTRAEGEATAFRFNPIWSPDSKKIAFSDKTGAIFIHDVAGASTQQIDRDPWQDERPAMSWSSDSGWLAYERSLPEQPSAVIFIHEVASGRSTQVTAGMFRDAQPVFDRKGDYLFFKSSRSFSPSYDEFGTTFIYDDSEVILAVPLRADMPSPMAPKSDEELWKSDAAATAPATAPTSAPTSAPAVDAATHPDPLTGTWTGKATDTITKTTVDCTFTFTLKSDGTVTGEASSIVGKGIITAGTFDAATGALSCTVSDPVGGAAATVTATLKDGVLTGEVTWQGQVADFALTRQAPAAASTAPAASTSPASAPATAPKPVRIDLEGFEGRAILLPIRNGRFGRLAVSESGHLIFARARAAGDVAAGTKIFDLADAKKEEKLINASTRFELSADGKTLLFPGNPPTLQPASAGSTAKAASLEGMRISVEPRAEWKQLFTDAWRIMRDFFYDPTMHGVDWAAVRTRYEAMLDDCAGREDVGYVISEMISELNVGHAYYRGPEESGPSMPVGLLGVDFELVVSDSGSAYRIAAIPQGGPWDADARGPLASVGAAVVPGEPAKATAPAEPAKAPEATQPTRPTVKVGDYLLAVNGVPVDAAKDPWAAFQGLVGRPVTITVSEAPILDASAREVIVEPVASEADMRYRAWIERNRKYVDEKSGGRIGYVYVPDTGVNGQNNLIRQFYGQIGKPALLIDERWNGGGQIPTRFIELLNRPVVNYWARRDGNDWRWPPDAHQGPKAMLINGLSGSGGDAFPHYFRQAGLGKLIGTRTWGGLVGITGYPDLIDGGGITAPSFAFYESDGTWGIEGHGVDPDLEVLDDPAKMAGYGDLSEPLADPQLDAAIDHLLKELAEKPFVAPNRPAYPDRRGMGLPEADR